MSCIGRLVSIMKNPKNHVCLRIIGGELHNRVVTFMPHVATRPTKSILRQSFFNTLGSLIVDYVFIEMFAGSGSMGIEAMSRGARKAIFIEYQHSLTRLLLENCTRLGILNKVEIIQADCFDVLDSLLQSQHYRVLLYCDPPFVREGEHDIYAQCFTFLESLCLDNVDVIVFEAMSKYPFPNHIALFSHIKERRFGKSMLHYYAKDVLC